MAFTEKNLLELSKLAIKHSASDIHLRTGEQPILRIAGNLVVVQSSVISSEDMLSVCSLITEIAPKDITNNSLNELDGSYELPEMCRFRFNIFRYNNHYGVVLRVINTNVPTLDELKFSPVVKEIANLERGLVLVTGATGSGKTTTLAAMLNEINEFKTKHIVTLEDPIEYLHSQKKGRITQREIGLDSDSFERGLRSALRQDPDVILIGEIRDAETIDIALKAAETGHLVFSTLHTTNATNTIGRIISMFEGNAQNELKKRLSETLKATIGQRMVEAKTGKTIIAQEILTTSPAVKDVILGNESLSRLTQIIEKGYEEGGTGRSQTFDQHLIELVNKQKITKEEAIANADNAYNMENKFLLI